MKKLSEELRKGYFSDMWRKTILAKVEALEAERDYYKGAIEFARDMVGIEARPCPLCVYENGVFIRECNMHREIESLRCERDRYRAALEQLVSRIEVVEADPEYMAVWFMAQLHRGPYAGPQYGAEMKAARAALSGDAEGAKP